jgi:hypothetical protein
MTRAPCITHLWLAGVVVATAAACGGKVAADAAPPSAGCGQSGSESTLASGLAGPYGIAVDDANVYLTSGTTVMSVAKCGGSPPVVLASGPQAGYVAVDATSVYWTAWQGWCGPSSIMSVPKGGGTAVKLASGTGQSGAIAVDDTSVYWTDSAHGTVMRTPKTGGASVVLGSGQGVPGADGTDGNPGVAIPLAIDGTNVYWADYKGVLKSAPKGSGPVATLSTTPTGWRAYALTVDSTHLYSMALNGTVTSIPKGGGAFVTLASGGPPNRGAPYGGGIATDATTVYWATGITGTILGAPKGGGPSRVFVSSTRPTGIAVDGTGIYWPAAGTGAPYSGAVIRVEK